MKKRLVFVTGTRADFGKLEPLASAAVLEGFNVVFFTTGMHMLEKYGLTKKEVSRTFEKVVEYVNQRHGDPIDVVLAKTVVGFSDYIVEAQPDLVVIHGDRVEAFACAIVCATNYVTCAHIEGGEVSGTIDEMFRHCNTKLSSIHLVSSEVAKRRVLAMGEAPIAIHVIGSPELDIHLRPSGVSISEVKSRYEIHFDDYGICIFHPVTSEVGTIGDQAHAFFSCLMESGKNFVLISPNNDPGAGDIFAEIDQLPKKRFRIIPSMRFRHFSELMKNASAIVGNSSAGVREAPFLGVPSLDVGSRQSNRALSEYVTHCASDDEDAIRKFLEGRWARRFKSHTGFGSGTATDKFTNLLKQGAFWNTPQQKYFVDVE